MATTDYAAVLDQARQLSPEERLRLANELVQETGTFRAVDVADEARITAEERAQIEAWLASSDELAKRISAAWKDDMSAAEAVQEQRREL